MNTLKTIPLPPKDHMELVCGDGALPDLENIFVTAGQKMREDMLASKVLFPGCRLLDIGCGCGRLARVLIDDQLESYTGFDRHKGMIDWCNSHLQPLAPHFSFHYFDLASAYQAKDSQSGDIKVESFQFPFDDGSFDVVMLTSVFTHMPLEEARHYLSEISRCLSKGGRVLVTVYLTKKTPYLTDAWNYYYNPEDFRDAVLDSDLKFSPDHEARLLSGADIGFDNHQQNGFLLVKE